mgnify:CR=1 FL=1
MVQMDNINEITTISITRLTKDKLASLCKKDESYETKISQLMWFYETYKDVVIENVEKKD